jgi:hypothetical protein
MTLTKQEAIEKHRKMWNWIADELEKGNAYKYYISRFEFLQTEPLKLAYFTEIKEYDFPIAGCYCCEYARRGKSTICKDCPLDWPGGKCVGENGLYRKINIECVEKNYTEAAKLARQIANLPENPNS